MLPLSSYQIHKALRRNILAGSLGSVFAVATTGTFLIGYALRLGASPFQIGLLSSLPLLCYPIQILASYVSERRRERKKTWILVAFIHRLIWVALVFTPFYVISSLSFSFSWGDALGSSFLLSSVFLGTSPLVFLDG